MILTTEIGGSNKPCLANQHPRPRHARNRFLDKLVSLSSRGEGVLQVVLKVMLLATLRQLVSIYLRF
jgi:hypothetical protein